MSTNMASIVVSNTGAVPLPWGSTTTLILNDGTNAIAIGATSAVTVSNGTTMPKSGVVTLYNFNGPLFAIANTAPVTVGVVASS